MRLLWLAILLSAPIFGVDPPGWQTLYREDFERGVLTGWSGGLDHFQVVKEGSNSVLAGEAHAKLNLNDGFWRDYRLKVRVKLVDQTNVVLFFRDTPCGNYEVSLDPGALNLTRQLGCGNYTKLANQPAAYETGRWYTLEVVGRGALIQIYMDGSLKLEVSDPDPVLAGSLGLMVRGSGHALFDDLEVAGPPDTGSLLWVRTGGPHGGVGYDIRMRPDNPDYLMVTDISSGVSISTDGGKTWRPSNQGITSRGGVSGDAIPIFCLTIDPNKPDTVWVGTQNMRGIWKSTDGGKSWVQKDRGVVEKTGITFRGFTVDPRNSSVVYAAAQIPSVGWAGQTRSGRMFDLSKGVVYKTIDGGENWNAVWRGDSLARYIWIDPRDSNVVYVSTGFFDVEAANTNVAAGYAGGVGILKSKDGGRTWRVLNEANGLKNLYVTSLFMHPFNPDILLAGAGNWAWDRDWGTYLSPDGGETWQRVLPEGALVVTSSMQSGAVEFAMSNPNIAYSAGVGFYRSQDGGRTWQSMARADGQWGVPGVATGAPTDLQVDPRNADRVFLNTYTGGNFLTEDGGKTWKLAVRGYTGVLMLDVAAHPADPRRVYAVGQGGIYRSDDAGGDWRPLDTTPLNPPADPTNVGGIGETAALAIDPRDPRNLIAAVELAARIQRSTDGGLTWRDVYQHPAVHRQRSETWMGFRALAFSTAQPDVVYAGTTRPRKIVDQGTDAPANGVFKSLDGGRTWREANDANTATQNINMLAVDPRSPNVVYAATYKAGVLCSTDGGGKWQPLNNGLRVLDVRSLAIDPSNPFVLYAGAERGGVYKSVNAGASWQPASAGMSPGAAVHSIVIDPTNTQVVYASDIQLGVFRSEDGGKLWIQISRGITMRAVRVLSLSADGSTLYAGTDGGGVYRLDVKPRAESALAALSAASFVKDGPVALASIVTLYGQGLAAGLLQSGSGTLPTVLGETQVSLTDSDGFDFWTPLYFVSPGQINFLVPAAAKTGPAQVRVFRQNKVIARGTTQVETVAPGIFTANSSGQGAPAAQAARYGVGGEQTAVPVFQCGATAGSCVPAAMDLGAESEQLILLLYGTGLRAARSLTATIGGVDATVLGFAAQSQYAGLDQVNVRVPRELKGRGDVDLLLKADNRAANTVRLRIQ